jgi:hypothetical protein
MTRSKQSFGSIRNFGDWMCCWNRVNVLSMVCKAWGIRNWTKRNRPICHMCTIKHILSSS